jgi:predicted nucleic acid-binding protein
VSELFADTAYWIALLNPRDDLHAAALDAEAAQTADRLVTSDMVLTELLNAFSGSQALRSVAVRAVQTLFSDARVSVEPQTRELFTAALATYAARLDKTWSLTDCTSMLIMERRAISDVLSSDHHFEQAGYRLAM